MRGQNVARILIIDDNENFLRSLSIMLEDEGHAVETAHDSDSGIKKHHQNPFDIIITDIVMPGKEGISTIIELKHENPKLKIIAVSGGGNYEPYGYLDIAKRVGAHRTLSKPFTREEIVDAVNDCIAG